MTKATDRRKHLTGGLLTVSEGYTAIMVGSRAAGRLGARAVAESLHRELQAGDRETEETVPGMVF